MFKALKLKTLVATAGAAFGTFDIREFEIV